MNSRTRITVALVGLILLVVLGWIVRGQSSGEQQSLSNHPIPPAVTSGWASFPHSE